MSALGTEINGAEQRKNAETEAFSCLSNVHYAAKVKLTPPLIMPHNLVQNKRIVHIINDPWPGI